MRTILLAALFALSATFSATTAARADWPADPATNFPVADLSGEQSIPKIRATSDGGAWVGWFDNSTGGYDVRVQHLSNTGVETFPHNGILVADRSFSSTQDWGVAIDADDHAFLAYRDDRVGGTQVGCNLTSHNTPQALLWGSGGRVLTSTTDFIASPRAAVTSDGGYVVAWTQGSTTRLQRLDASGTTQWASDVVLTPASGSYSASDLQPGDDGSVIVLLVHSVGSARQLHAQKISSAGAQVWNGGAPLPIFNTSSIQNGYFPTFVHDGSGGAIFGWYENGGARNVYVQRVDPDGFEIFAHNGVSASTLAGRIRLTPSLAHNRDTGEIFIFWVESNTGQSLWGLYGQKFAFDGEREWGDSARALLPLDATQEAGVRALRYLDGAMVFYFDASGSRRIGGMRLDGLGQQVWTPVPLLASSTASGKDRLDVAATPSGMALLAWMDARSGANDIYVQNVKPAGTFGNPPFIRGDLNCDAAINTFDIDPFVLALANAAAYAAAYPTCDIQQGDVNADGAVNTFDIDPFVTVLTGG